MPTSRSLEIGKRTQGQGNAKNAKGISLLPLVSLGTPVRPSCYPKGTPRANNTRNLPYSYGEASYAQPLAEKEKL